MDRCRCRGRDKESSLVVCGMAADGRKRGESPPFLMGDAFSVIMVELSPLHFML